MRILMFSEMARFDQLRETLELIKTAEELSALRKAVLNHNRRGFSHPLKDAKYGFAAVFNALNDRANELDFYPLGDGYRQPIAKQTPTDMAKKITPEVALKELERELSIRERYYPEWSKGPSPKLKPDQAEHRIECIKWAIANLKQQIAGTKGEQQTLF